MIRDSSLKSEFSWILLGNLFYAAMQYLMLIVLVKLTTPTLVGQFSFGLAVNAPIALFMSMAIRAVVISDSKNRFSKKTFFNLRALTAAGTVAAALLFILISRQSGVTAHVILIISVIKALESISDLIYGFMQKFGHTNQIAKSLMARGLLSFILASGFLFRSRSIEWLCFGWMLATLAVLVIYDLPRIPATPAVPSPDAAAIQNRPQNRLQSRSPSRSMAALFFLALPLGIAAVLSSLETNVPRYFIEGALGLSSLGIFSALSYPLMLTNQVVGSLASAPAPRLAFLFHDRKYTEFTDLLNRLVLIAAGISGLSAVVCFLIGRPVLALLNGPVYALESHTFVTLSIATAFTAVATFYGAALNAMQCFYTKLILQAVSLLTVAAAAAVAASQKTLFAMSLALLAGGAVSLMTQFTAFKIQYRQCVRGIHEPA